MTHIILVSVELEYDRVRHPSWSSIDYRKSCHLTYNAKFKKWSRRFYIGQRNFKITLHNDRNISDTYISLPGANQQICKSATNMTCAAESNFEEVTSKLPLVHFSENEFSAPSNRKQRKLHAIELDSYFHCSSNSSYKRSKITQCY